MSTARHVFRQGSIYTFGSLLQLSASAIVVPATTRLLPPREYGLLGLAVVFQVLLGTACTAGLPAAITRRYFDGGRSHTTGAHHARRLVVSAAIIALLGTLATLASVNLWSTALVGGGSVVVYLGVGLGFPQAVLVSAQALLIAEERPWSFTAVALLGSLGAQVCGVMALLVVSRHAAAYLAGVLVAMLVACAAALILSGAAGSRPAGRQALRQALHLGAPTLPHLLGVYVIALSDRLVIQAIDGPKAVARYQIAYALGAIAQTVLVGLQSAWLPATFRSKPEHRWKQLAAISTLVVKLASLLAGALALAAPLGLFVLAPSSYDTASLVPVTAVIAASAIPWAVYLPFIQILLWEKRTKSLLWIVPVAASINVGLAIALLPPFGLIGAAVATPIAFVTQGVLAGRAARVANVTWDRAGIAQGAAVGVCLFGAAVLLPQSLVGNVMRGILTVGAVCSAFRTLRTGSSSSGD